MYARGILTALRVCLADVFTLSLIKIETPQIELSDGIDFIKMGLPMAMLVTIPRYLYILFLI